MTVRTTRTQTQAKAIDTKTLRTLLFLAALTALVFFLCGGDAWAQTRPLAKDMVGVQKSIAVNAAVFPKFIAFICYVMGTFFTVTGLLKLKDWAEQGDKVGMWPGLMRLIVATLLITLPHMILLTTSTFFARKDGRVDSDLWVTPPSMQPFQKVK
jgi:hypothetical protein